MSLLIRPTINQMCPRRLNSLCMSSNKQCQLKLLLLRLFPKENVQWIPHTNPQSCSYMVLKSISLYQTVCQLSFPSTCFPLNQSQPMWLQLCATLSPWKKSSHHWSEADDRLPSANIMTNWNLSNTWIRGNLISMEPQYLHVSLIDSHQAWKQHYNV